jgi:nicotinamide riboside transporter PnuC
MVMINIILVISAVIGMYLLAKRNRLGFLVFFITEICYFILGHYTQQYGLIATAGVYLSMNIYSYLEWGKKERIDL